ncbi:TPA: hypothetical protein ACHJ3T_004920, partial [Escherichia coli]
ICDRDYVLCSCQGAAMKFYSLNSARGGAMKKAKMLASIAADTSRIESKISALLEVLPEHVPDKLVDMVAGLICDIRFVNDPPAVGTSGSFDILYVLDFDPAAYSEVMAAARAFKVNLVH